MVNGILYVGDSSGLTVYDLGTPATPSTITTVERPWWSGTPTLRVCDDLLVVDVGDSLLTFDVSAPASPQPLGGRSFVGTSLVVDGGLAFALSDSALHILDLSDPVSLPQLGQTSQPDGEDLAVGYGFAYVCNYAVNGGIGLWGG